MMADMAHTLRRGPCAGILRAALNNLDLLPAPTESVGQSWGQSGPRSARVGQAAYDRLAGEMPPTSLHKDELLAGLHSF